MIVSATTTGSLGTRRWVADMDRAECLTRAQALITGQRAEDYGDAETNHRRIGRLWCDYLGLPISAIQPEDVAVMMILLKVARMQHSLTEYSLVDVAGYAALACEIISNKPEVRLVPRDNCPNDETPEDQVLRAYYSSEDYANVSKGGP